MVRGKTQFAKQLKEITGYYTTMAALFDALDSQTAMQIGEKGHAEYAWSNDLQEKILQLSFQFTRCDSETIELHAQQLEELLRNLKGEKLSREKMVELMTVAYKMIAHTRDIIDGKGEYSLAYMQILVWNKFYPELAQFALTKFVLEENNGHPYGSWKDIKYFCQYCKSNGLSVQDPLMQHAFSLLLGQIRRDATISANSNQSLVAKWVPRAKSVRFGWIFNELSVMYFKEFIETAKTTEQMDRAINKCKMSFRKLLADLNKRLDTVQIHQCNGTWSEIDHAKTTSITVNKQRKAFLNINKDGEQRSTVEDRVSCATNFTNYIKKTIEEHGDIKGKRIGLNHFAQEALELLSKKITPELQVEIDILNSQWRDNATQTNKLGPMVAMLDFSGSMSGDPLFCAMALGCRIAEKSILGRRIMSFSKNPTWHNLDGCNDFVDMIRVLKKGEVGYATNFYGAFDRILDAIIEMKLTPDQVEGMILGIFSDMQIDTPDVGIPDDMNSFYETVEEKYAQTGLRLWNKPFKPPHILFWNLRSTKGFPSLSSQRNVSMMSGFSPALLNLFCEKGLDALQGCTPWSILIEQMNKPRYQCMEEKVKETFAVV